MAVNDANFGSNQNRHPLDDGFTIHVAAQYIKDFSFENPNAPQSFITPPKNPGLKIQVNVNAAHKQGNQFEVELVLEGTAEEEQGVLFKFELNYAGLFHIDAPPQLDLQAIVLIECPKLLFPFARQIIAENVRNGAFPPLYVEMIDFANLYQQRGQAGNDKGLSPIGKPGTKLN